MHSLYSSSPCSPLVWYSKIPFFPHEKQLGEALDHLILGKIDDLGPAEVLTGAGVNIPAVIEGK